MLFYFRKKLPQDKSLGAKKNSIFSRKAKKYAKLILVKSMGLDSDALLDKKLITKVNISKFPPV